MTNLNSILQAEIAANGAISFARFMELALYCPSLGYYETDRQRVGWTADFYTSVSTGELFGQLLAFRFAQWLSECHQTTSELWLVEAGAHDGQLAKDILAWLQEQKPELYARVRYAIVEPSPQRKAWQQEKLSNFGTQVIWFNQLAELASSSSSKGITGVIFSNELLDAMPVHRLGWDANQQSWFEWGVGWAEPQFTWTRLAPAKHGPPQEVSLPPELLAVLPDGYTIEISPEAEAWWQTAAGCLQAGRLLASDYGFTEAERITPERTRGTLRAYRQHQMVENLLANPGEQDLTAHVNFSAIQAVGERRGLITEAYLTQPQFLTRILADAIKDPSFADWNARRTRQFQTLTHPQHLGRAFKVLVQRRDGSRT